MTWAKIRHCKALIPLFVVALAACAQAPNAPQPASQAAAPNPQSAGVLNVADAAIAGNDPEMALKVSQSILATDPTNQEALYHEAAAYYAIGRCEDSIAAYQLALKTDPKSAEAETGIGRCLLKRDAGQAEQAFELAVQDDPGNAAALSDLGIARDLQGNYSGATQPYEQALLIEPGQTATEVNLGFSLALSGDGADALQYLGPLATGDEATPQIRQDYAAALVADGRTDEAAQVLAVDLPPDQVNTLLQAFAAAISTSKGDPPAPPVAAPTTPVAAVTPVEVDPAPTATSDLPAPDAATTDAAASDNSAVPAAAAPNAAIAAVAAAPEPLAPPAAPATPAPAPAPVQTETTATHVAAATPTPTPAPTPAVAAPAPAAAAPAPIVAPTPAATATPPPPGPTDAATNTILR